MPQRSQLHVNQLLSNVSVQYKNQEYLWDKIFPIVNVSKDSDLYRVYEKNYRIHDTSRAPKGLAKEMSFEVSTAGYYLEQHALKDFVGVDEAENYDQGSLQVDATEYLTDAIYRRIELSVASLFTKTSWSLSVSLSATTTFAANTTVSDPVPIFDTAASTIIANSGVTPNFGFISRQGYVNCKNHVSVLDRVKYTNSEVGQNILAALFGLPELMISNAMYNTGELGAATSTAAGAVNYFADMAFVGYKPAAPGLKQVSCGYTFMKNAPRVRTWFDDERNATAVEVEVKYQPKVVASLTGYLIGNVE